MCGCCAQVDGQGKFKNRPWFDYALSALRDQGVHGVATDVWVRQLLLGRSPVFVCALRTHMLYLCVVGGCEYVRAHAHIPHACVCLHERPPSIS
jgi:hypothetical protein